MEELDFIPCLSPDIFHFPVEIELGSEAFYCRSEGEAIREFQTR